MASEPGSQLGGWMIAASTPPSSISLIASAGVNDVTCQCDALLGRPVPHVWIWASMIGIPACMAAVPLPAPRAKCSPLQCRLNRRRPVGSYDVIVAGAGPVGLTLAIDLGRRGVRTLLLERSPTTLP